MKVFYLLITSLLVSFANAEEEKWYDAEGNVVRVFNRDKAPAELERNESLLMGAYQWDSRRIWRKSHLRGRAIYGNGSHFLGHGFGHGNWSNYYHRGHHRNGWSYQSHCRPSHYRGSILNIVISR